MRVRMRVGLRLKDAGVDEDEGVDENEGKHE